MSTPSTSSAASGVSRRLRWKEQLRSAIVFTRQLYFTVDARTLGFFRICFGLHLIANIYDRTKGGDALAFYTNEGVVPNHYAIYAPLAEKQWSFLYPVSTFAEMQVAFALILLVYVAYVVGWHTKLAQILVVVCLLSLTNRNLALQNGGIVVTNVVAIWTMFMPVGARFSVDHLLKSLRKRNEATPAELNDREAMVVSDPWYARVAFLGILLNFCGIYFFNYAHKTGVTWRDGSAIHWVLWQNRIATTWAAILRMHEPAWLSPVLTRSTLVIEAVLPVLLLFPARQKWTRRAAILAIWSLHSGISLMMSLGPFSYSMMSFSLLLISAHDWEWVERLAAWKGARLSIRYDPTKPRLHLIARVLARLDARGALELRDIAEPGDPNAAATPEPVKPALVVVDPRTGRSAHGAAGLGLAVRALPLGILYAWLFGIPLIRSLVQGWMEKTGPTGDGATEEVSADSPARQLKRAVLRGMGELLACLLLFAIVIQLASDNWIIPDRYRVKKKPHLTREIIEYLRLPQGWSMFSPDAPKEDGTIVVDALLSDGRHIDPRKQLPPDFEAAYHGPWWDDQQWCDWDLRMKFDGSRHFHGYFREYIAHLDKIASWKQGADIKYFEVYWVNNSAPPPGTTQPFNIQKQLLFTGGVRP